jgi:hypothetical protein
MTIGSGPKPKMRGWTPAAMDPYMARQGHRIVSEGQFGGVQDSFGGVPKWSKE